MREPFGVDALDDTELVEIDWQAADLVKHPHFGLDGVMDAWSSGFRCCIRPSRRPVG
ncbi:hypothetical protein [Serinicoccus sp. LYQ131]|uniref:hypothetical protein n=1 Tax=Serinicoccus sp. LYQ131 TaxID=3378797 RepID=UPI003852947B